MNKIIQAFVIIGLCSMAFGVSAQSDLALVRNFNMEMSRANETERPIIKDISIKSTFSDPMDKDSLNVGGTKDSTDMKQADKSVIDWQRLPWINSNNSIIPLFAPPCDPVAIGFPLGNNGTFEAPGSENDFISENGTVLKRVVDPINPNNHCLYMHSMHSKGFTIKANKFYVIRVKLYMPFATAELHGNDEFSLVDIYPFSSNMAFDCPIRNFQITPYDVWRTLEMHTYASKNDALVSLRVDYNSLNTNALDVGFYLDNIELIEYGIADQATVTNATGTITLNPCGGLPGSQYTFEWLDGLSTSSTRTGLKAGTYTVNVGQVGEDCIKGTFTYTITSCNATSPTASNPGPGCLGGQVQLSATTVPNATLYSWTGPNNFTSKQQNPLLKNLTAAMAGAYNVTAKVGNCTSQPSSTTVVVNSNPTVTASYQTPVCTGGTLTLKATPPAGATYTYSWTGPGGFTSNVQNPSLPAKAGTYKVTATLPDGSCSSTSSTTVTLTTVTAPTAQNNGPICESETLQLSVLNPVAGTTYSWTGPNGFTSNLQNPQILNANPTQHAGDYRVQATIGGCSSALSAATTAVINPTPVPNATANTPCEGGTLSLSTPAVAGATYSWSGPNGFTSALRNPQIISAKNTDAGPYIVTVTAKSCTGTSTVNVTINQTSTVTASSNSPVCTTGTLELKATPPAGATYIYSWTGPGPFTSSEQNPSLPAKAGTYKVTATLPDGSCSSTSSTTVTLTTVTAPTAQNNGPICESQTLKLSVLNPVAGVTYSWTGPNGFTSNLQNPQILNASPTQHTGDYQVQATTGGCTSALSAPIKVVINSLPTALIPNNNPYCTGNPLALSTPAVNGATYLWEGPNNFTSTVRNPQVTASLKSTDAGYYKVSVTTKGCTNVSVLDVVVNPAPTVTASSNSPVCSAGTLELQATTIPGATYSWTGPGPFTSNIQNPSLPAKAGTYIVTTTLGSCTSTSSTNVVVNTVPKSTAGNTGPVCEGGSFTLTATAVAGATYSWTGPNGFISTDQNPVITQATVAQHAGVYQVQAIIGDCKSVLSATTVVVNPIPIATASYQSPLCEGATLKLSTPAVAGATYSWSGPNGFTSAVRNPQITTSTTNHSGAYNVTVIAKGCTSVVSSVDVIVSPVPDAPIASNNGPLCNGADLQLNATTVAGATYSWTGPNGYTSTEQNPLIEGVTSSGNYKVRAIVGSCSSAVATSSVTVKQLKPGPAASANSPVCFGGNINLKATTVAGATLYTWTGPDGFTSNLQNPTATATTTGDYKVIAVVAGCPTAEGMVHVLVNPAGTGPSASGNSPVCEGGILSLNASPIPGTTYSWSGPDGFTSNVANPTITGIKASQAGDYKVKSTGAGCTSAETIVTIVVDPMQPGPEISGNTNLCAGGVLNLSVTPVIDGAAYTWVQPNGSTFTGPTLTVPDLIYTNAGIYKVTSKTGNCSSSVSSVSVTVNSFSFAPTAGNQGGACEGGTIRLTASGTSGASYSWEGPNGFSSSEQNPILYNVTTTQAGSYKVKYVSGACFSAESATNVVVNPTPGAPAASNDSPVCPNGSVQLSVNAVSGAQYKWTGPDGFTSNLPNPVVNNVTEKSAGTYKVTATINGCLSPAGSTKVEVSPLAPPQVDNQGIYCLGTPIILTASSPVSGVSFQWTGPNDFTASGSTVNIPQATFAAVGKYSVYAEVNGCKSETADTYVSVGKLITATENHTNATGIGKNDGTIAVKVISGAPPYQFKINQGNFTVDNNFVNLAEGTYSVTVKYGNSCTYEIKDIVIKQGTDDCVR